MTKGPSFTPIAGRFSETGRNHALILPPWHGRVRDLVSVVAHQEIAVVIEYLSRPCPKKKRNPKTSISALFHDVPLTYLSKQLTSTRETKREGVQNGQDRLPFWPTFGVSEILTDGPVCLSFPPTSQSAHFLLIKSFPNRTSIFEVCGFGGASGAGLICIRRAPLFHLPA